jgi:6,7-dimethyl-8-ribityllumazine synthase
MSEEVKSLEDQLQDQKQQLEENIRQTETQMGRLKEQYLKVLGALEFAAIQKQETEGTETDAIIPEDVTS